MTTETTRDRAHFLLLNIGHLLDHLFTLIFATVAALALSREWGMSYADLLAYATPGFFAFGLFSLPAGWIADRWNRDGMMCVFFVGIGVSAIATSFAGSPLQIGLGLFVVGMFAAIYHPVGLAIVTERWKNTGMRIAVNGVWGNLGVAGAALLSGFLIDLAGWRTAFIVPGVISILVGLAYAALRWPQINAPRPVFAKGWGGAAAVLSPETVAMLKRVSIIVFLTTSVSSLIFQSTTFALPKVFDERLQGITETVLATLKATGLAGRSDVATMVGLFAFAVYAIASLAQLVVGGLLDKWGPRPIFVTAAAIQVVFFALMPGTSEGAALAVTLGFMIGAFGQIPITDYMIGKMASGQFRSFVYGVRYVVSFTVLAISLPFIAFVYSGWGFDTLFRVLAVAAVVIMLAAACLPSRLPSTSAAVVPARS